MALWLVYPARLCRLLGLDLGLALDKQDYRKRLERAQYRLLEQTQRKAFRDRALVMAFEGHDAAGKGGAIRRVAMALDPRQYRIHPIAAPTAEEKARPYLWRFWRDVPRRGRIAIFDRSWYGRVLVERVEKFCAESDWMRAYHEINEFEEQLATGGAIVAKFWLAISPEHLSRMFSALAKAGVIRLDKGWIYVPKLERLAKVAEG